MTNLQLLLTIGIPSLLVVLSWIQQSTRLSRLESSYDRGFEGVERRFEAVDQKFEAVDRKFDAVDRKFDAIRIEMVALRDSIHRDMVSLHKRVAVVESKQS